MPIRGPRAPQAPQGEPCGCAGRCGSHWLDTQIVAQVVQGGYAMHVFPDPNKKLTAPQIAAVITATAIALTESNGYTQACNHNVNGSYDRGLWQINDVWGSLSDYSTDAHNMWEVRRRSGNSFRAWNGDLVRRGLYIPRATKAVAAYLKSINQEFPIIQDPLGGNILGPGFPGGAGDAPGPCIHRTSFGGIAGIGGFDICWDTLFGGLKVIGGGLILGIAGLAILYITAKEMGAAPAVSKATGAVKAVTPAGTVRRAYRSRASSPAAAARVATARARAEGSAAVARERRRTVAARERASVKRAKYRYRTEDAKATQEISKTERRVRADEGGYKVVGGAKVYSRG